MSTHHKTLRVYDERQTYVHSDIYCESIRSLNRSSLLQNRFAYLWKIFFGQLLLSKSKKSAVMGSILTKT